MKLQPLSKSKYEVFLRCPWKAHALKNLGFEDTWGLPAENGIEAHLLLAEIVSGRLQHTEATARASSNEVAYLVSQGLKHCLVQDPSVALFENRVMIDKKGVVASDESASVLHGILDIMEPLPSEGVLRIDDWKTGKWEKDSQAERHFYVLLGHALFPDLPTVQFNLVFVRTGHILTSEYSFSKRGDDVLIKPPSGGEERLSDPKGGLLAWLAAILRRIKTTPAKPNPGKHCTNWYGSVCAFHGFECPLSSKLPATTHAMLLPDYEEYKKGFLLLKDHPDTLTDPVQVGNGYYAATQIEAAIKAVKQNAEAWANQHGPFRIGEDEYGWHNKPSSEVDVEFAIRTLVDSGMPFGEIAKAVNISKTSLSRISKRNYPELRALLENLAISTVTKRRFGAIPNKKEIEE